MLLTGRGQVHCCSHTAACDCRSQTTDGSWHFCSYTSFSYRMALFTLRIYTWEKVCLKLSAKTGDVLVRARSVRPASVPGRLVFRHFHYLLYHRDLQARRRCNLPVHKVSLFEELTQSSLSLMLNLIRSRGKRFMRKRLSFGFFRYNKHQLRVACTSVYCRRLAQICSFTSLSLEDFYVKKRQLNV